MSTDAKEKALKLTLDKLDKMYGKGAVMKLGDGAIEEIALDYAFALKIAGP